MPGAGGPFSYGSLLVKLNHISKAEKVLERQNVMGQGPKVLRIAGVL